jgi:hypothetical protein
LARISLEQREKRCWSHARALCWVVAHDQGNYKSPWLDLIIYIY